MGIPLETEDMEWIIKMINEEIVFCESVLRAFPQHKEASENMRRGREIIVKIGLASIGKGNNDIDGVEINPRNN